MYLYIICFLAQWIALLPFEDFLYSDLLPQAPGTRLTLLPIISLLSHFKYSQCVLKCNTVQATLGACLWEEFVHHPCFGAKMKICVKILLDQCGVWVVGGQFCLTNVWWVGKHWSVLLIEWGRLCSVICYLLHLVFCKVRGRKHFCTKSRNFGGLPTLMYLA